eukprot:TRINITY_DN10575_c0_g1_i1.p1 TRINITY_DN10575_c0_g1~~TRINITY_DN10575_c0_g1_i1.p1  ORF type:complete len:537 (+),score=138.85 TRINITY_DN10575_c0_g1_i1:164-1612(+)
MEENQNDEGNTLRENVFYKYVIVGGGVASLAGLMGIRINDKNSPVLIITDEDEFYSRNSLSKKETWEYDEERFKKIFFPPNLYSEATVWLSTRASKFNLTEKTITIQNKTVHFDKILIATGSTPRRLKGIAKDAEEYVSTFKTISDFKKLYEISSDPNKHILVVGGSFLGTELTSQLSKRGSKITHLFQEKSPLQKYLPDYLSLQLIGEGHKRGVNFFPGRRVVGVVKLEDSSDRKIKALLDNGNEIECDHIVVAIGNVPNSEFAYGNALELDEKLAIKTNGELFARSGVWAAGDVCSYYSVGMEKNYRFCHLNDSIESGFTAGKNMSGESEVLFYQPIYFSEVFDKTFHVVGDVSSSHNTYAIWAKSPQELLSEQKNSSPSPSQNLSSDDNLSAQQIHDLHLSNISPKDTVLGDRYAEEGIVYYINKKNNRLVGVLFWDSSYDDEHEERALELINERVRVRDLVDASYLIPIVPKTKSDNN